MSVSSIPSRGQSGRIEIAVTGTRHYTGKIMVALIIERAPDETLQPVSTLCAFSLPLQNAEYFSRRQAMLAKHDPGMFAVIRKHIVTTRTSFSYRAIVMPPEV